MLQVQTPKPQVTFKHTANIRTLKSPPNPTGTRLSRASIQTLFTEPGPPVKKRNLRSEQGAAWQEVVQMRDVIDSFLAAPFFREVGRLTRVPFESQTLQKRGGYREIFHAFLMLDVAAQIDWPGRNDAYDRTNRDVATLYEFWLYFVLVRAFEEKLGMKRDSDPSDKEVDGARPFCCTGDDGRMMIHLKRDEASFCRFSWGSTPGSLRIHFFYNRKFNRSGVNVRGTYSKGFQPDYTLVIIPGAITEPDWEEAERMFATRRPHPIQTRILAKARLVFKHQDRSLRPGFFSGISRNFVATRGGTFS